MPLVAPPSALNTRSSNTTTADTDRMHPQFVFLGPAPILLLVWLMADEVLWVYFGFTVPAIVFSLIIIPSWSKQDSVFRAMASHRVRVIQR